MEEQVYNVFVQQLQKHNENAKGQPFIFRTPPAFQKDFSEFVHGLQQYLEANGIAVDAETDFRRFQIRVMPPDYETPETPNNDELHKNTVTKPLLTKSRSIPDEAIRVVGSRSVVYDLKYLDEVSHPLDIYLGWKPNIDPTTINTRLKSKEEPAVMNRNGDLLNCLVTDLDVETIPENITHVHILSDKTVLKEKKLRHADISVIVYNGEEELVSKIIPEPGDTKEESKEDDSNAETWRSALRHAAVDYGSWY